MHAGGGGGKRWGGRGQGLGVGFKGERVRRGMRSRGTERGEWVGSGVMRRGVEREGVGG